MKFSGRCPSGRSTALFGVALAGVVLVAAAGCSDSEDVYGVATYESFGSASDAGLLEGLLKLEAVCAYVITEDKTVLPVFPFDEVERSDSDLTYGGQSFSDGDRIELEGVAGTLDSWATVPEECDVPEGEVWVVGQTD